MRPIQVRCPTCGASLPLDDTATSITCSYCGTSSRIQARTGVFQRPAPLPPGNPMPVARQRMRWSYALMLVPISIGLISSYVATRNANRMVASSTAAGKLDMRWSGKKPVLTDVDGDGVDDLVGIDAYIFDGNRVHLLALSGTTGATLWESPALGAFEAVNGGEVAVAADRILRTTATGRLLSYDRATGAPGWTIELGEKVEQLCAGDEPGAIAVGTADERWHRVELATGARTDRTPLLSPRQALPRPAKPPTPAQLLAEPPVGACRPLMTSASGQLSGVRSVDRWATLPEVQGMSLDRLARLGDGPVVAIGDKRPGTSVPMLAVLDGAKPRWKAEIPSSDPLNSSSDDTHVAISGDAVFAIYEPSKGLPRVTAFALADGHRLWDQAVTSTSSSINLTGLVTNGRTVTLTAWGHLEIFDAATGARIFLSDR